MKASELRIGNKIYNELEDDIIPVEASDLLAMVHCELVGKEVDWITPVPLSEEMLIKFGFRHSVHGHWFTITRKKDSKKFGRLILFGGVGNLYPGRNMNALKKIEYVHQLENLYYAITGEELESKKTV